MKCGTVEAFTILASDSSVNRQVCCKVIQGLDHYAYRLFKTAKKKNQNVESNALKSTKILEKEENCFSSQSAIYFGLFGVLGRTKCSDKIQNSQQKQKFLLRFSSLSTCFHSLLPFQLPSISSHRVCPICIEQIPQRLRISCFHSLLVAISQLATFSFSAET